MTICPICRKELIKDQKKYCSNACQMTEQYSKYIHAWKVGVKHGGKGLSTRGVSSHVKKYLLLKFGEKCAECGWKKRNPATGKVPLEIDHLDGNAENNTEENLRLICPNCHSLSPNFRNLNKGRGRAWRKAKYLKNSLEKVMV